MCIPIDCNAINTSGGEIIGLDKIGHVIPTGSRHVLQLRSYRNVNWRRGINAGNGVLSDSYPCAGT